MLDLFVHSSGLEKANKRCLLVKPLRQVPISWKPSLGLRVLGMARPQSLKLAPKQVTRIGALDPCLGLPRKDLDPRTGDMWKVRGGFPMFLSK